LISVDVDEFAGSHTEVKLLVLRREYLAWTHVRDQDFLKSIIYLFEVAEAMNERKNLKLVNAFALV
jgi:hypothetical protein